MVVEQARIPSRVVKDRSAKGNNYIFYVLWM